MTDPQTSNGLRVLLATDGSECADVALNLVRSIEWPPEAQLRLVVAVEPQGSVGGGSWAPAVGQDLDRELADAVAAAEAVLARAAETLRQTSAAVERAVLEGRVASAIVDDATAFGADLIVVGSRGHGTIGSMVLGSVSGEVADHAHCPVLVARGNGIDRVIVATDGSTFARSAEAIVSAWPIFSDSAIEVVSVADTRLPWTSSLALSASPVSGDEFSAGERQIVADFQRIADDAARRLKDAGRLAAPRVLQGDAAGELLRVAGEEQADLIVLGTHGRTGLRRLVSGSVARNVMLHAPCSVMIVREVHG